MEHPALKPLDYFFLLRPTLWFPVWTVILCGAGGADLAFGLCYYGLSAILGLTILMGAVYLLNQINDIDTDRLNDKLHFLGDGLISKRSAIIYFIALVVVGSFFLLLSENWKLVITAAAIIIITGGLYNLGKAAMKNQPWGSLLVTLLGGVGVWMIGYVLGRRLLPPDWLEVAAYASAFSAVGLMTMIPDIEGDRQSGKTTFAVRYGAKNTSITALILCIIALSLSLFFRYIPLAIGSISGIPFILSAAINPNAKRINLAVKIPIFVLSIAVAILYYRLYLLLIVGYFVFARLYYRLRFNKNYPSFTSD